MGLDMYLSSKKSGQDAAYWRKANQIHRWFVENVQDGIDECQESDVSLGQLIELRDACKKVLGGSKVVTGIVANGQTCSPETGGVFQDNLEVGGVIKDFTLAEKLLPTQGGFFFGGTDYDKWYLEELKDTVEKLTLLIDNAEKDEVFVYCSLW